MVSSSSTKKAAKLAQKGKGKKVRFQGGTLFPMIVLAILVVGLGTIVYARATVPGRRRLAPDGRRPLARRLRLLALRQRGVRPARRGPRGGRQQRPADQQRLPAHRRAQPRRRRDPLARLHVGGGRQERHARRVPRQLRRRARRRLAAVPGEPERRQGVRRGRDEVPRRRGRRAVGHRVAEPRGHERRAPLRVRASTTSASTRTASCSRSPSSPAGTDIVDAAVGRRPRASSGAVDQGADGAAGQRAVEHRARRLVARRHDRRTGTPADDAGATTSAPSTTVAPTTTGG